MYRLPRSLDRLPLSQHVARLQPPAPHTVWVSRATNPSPHKLPAAPSTNDPQVSGTTVGVGVRAGKSPCGPDEDAADELGEGVGVAAVSSSGAPVEDTGAGNDESGVGWTDEVGLGVVNGSSKGDGVSTDGRRVSKSGSTVGCPSVGTDVYSAGCAEVSFVGAGGSTIEGMGDSKLGTGEPENAGTAGTRVTDVIGAVGAAGNVSDRGASVEIAGVGVGVGRTCGSDPTSVGRSVPTGVGVGRSVEEGGGATASGGKVSIPGISSAGVCIGFDVRGTVGNSVVGDRVAISVVKGTGAAVDTGSVPGCGVSVEGRRVGIGVPTTRGAGVSRIGVGSCVVEGVGAGENGCTVCPPGN